MTSHDVVDWVRDLTGLDKVGHTGTLDPGGSGVLVVLLGRATRVARFFADNDKEYLAEAIFGAETDTQDVFGRIVEYGEASNLTQEDVLRVLPLFEGEIAQVPPLVSAVRHRGKRLYEIARTGGTAEVPPRVVRISGLAVLRGEWGVKAPRALFRISCSKGTYIRTLVTDIGRALGCRAHLGFLLRIRAGRFTIASARTLEELAGLRAEGRLESAIIRLEEIFAHLPKVEVKRSAVKSVKSGGRLYPAGAVNDISQLSRDLLVRLVSNAELLAIARVENFGGRTVLKPVWVNSVQ